MTDAERPDPLEAQFNERIVALEAELAEARTAERIARLSSDDGWKSFRELRDVLAAVTAERDEARAELLTLGIQRDEARRERDDLREGFVKKCREEDTVVIERDALALALRTGVDFVEHGAPNEHFMEWAQHAREALTAPGAARVLREVEALRELAVTVNADYAWTWDKLRVALAALEVSRKS